MTTADLHHYFSRSYAEARAKFLSAAQARGWAVHSHALDLPGRDGEALALDVVRVGPTDASRLLLTTSAVHGVEGFCGSGVQTAWLRGVAPTLPLPPDTAVLHVHAVNPHGFSHLRRVTQENVDLNRNFVDFSLALPDKPDYRLLHPLLLPEQWPPSAGHEQALADQQAAWGPRRAQLAVTGGQHSHADGLFFGGTAPTWSNQVFRAVLRQHASACTQLAWIDIHTGLGPFAVGERIFACPDASAPLSRARQWWGTDVTSVNTGSSTSIPMTGPIQMAVADECPQADYTGICLEFGTVPSAQMHRVLRAEHWLHTHPEAAAAQAAQIKADLLAAFYPDSEEWRERVWAQASEAMGQALQGLAALPMDATHRVAATQSRTPASSDTE